MSPDSSRLSGGERQYRVVQDSAVRRAESRESRSRASHHPSSDCLLLPVPLPLLGLVLRRLELRVGRLPVASRKPLTAVDRERVEHGVQALLVVMPSPCCGSRFSSLPSEIACRHRASAPSSAKPGLLAAGIGASIALVRCVASVQARQELGEACQRRRPAWTRRLL